MEEVSEGVSNLNLYYEVALHSFLNIKHLTSNNLIEVESFFERGFNASHHRSLPPSPSSVDGGFSLFSLSLTGVHVGAKVMVAVGAGVEVSVG